MKGAKMVNDPRDIIFDNVPTFLEGSSSEAIQPGHLTTRHIIDDLLNLLLGDGTSRSPKSCVSKFSSSQLKSMTLGPPFLMTLKKCSWIISSLRSSLMTHPCAFLSLRMWLSPSSSVDSSMEEFSVCVSFLQGRHSCILLFSSPLKHRQPNNLSFKPCPNVVLLADKRCAPGQCQGIV